MDVEQQDVLDIEMQGNNQGGSSADSQPLFNSNSLPDLGYMRPTFSSKTTSYLHAEIERVTNSYRCGSFWSLKKLPDKIEPGRIQSMRIKFTNDNLSSTNKAFIVKSSPANLPDSRIEYIGTDYHKNEFIHRQQLEEHRVRIEGSSKKAFLPSSSRIKDKFEDIFDNDNFKYPYMGPGQGLLSLDKILRDGKNLTDESSIEQFLKSRAEAKSKGLTGPPADPTNGTLKHNNKDYINYNIKEWSQKIYAQLKVDWPHLKFKLKFIAEGELLVQFDLSGMLNKDELTPEDCINASIHKYMSNMMTHGVASEAKMVKRGDRWGVIEFDVFKANNGNNKGSISGRLNNSDSQNIEGNEFNVTRDVEKSALLTYSLICPWVKSQTKHVKKVIGEQWRTIAKQSYFDDIDKKKTKQANEERDTYGATLNEIKNDVRKIPFNPNLTSEIAAMNRHKEDFEKDADNDKPFLKHKEKDKKAESTAPLSPDERRAQKMAKETADFLIISDQQMTYNEKLKHLGLTDLFLDGKMTLSSKAMRDPQLVANQKMVPKPIPLPGTNLERWRVPLDFDLFNS